MEVERTYCSLAPQIKGGRYNFVLTLTSVEAKRYVHIVSRDVKLIYIKDNIELQVYYVLRVLL